MFIYEDGMPNLNLCCTILIGLQNLIAVSKAYGLRSPLVWKELIGITDLSLYDIRDKHNDCRLHRYAMEQ